MRIKFPTVVFHIISPATVRKTSCTLLDKKLLLMVLFGYSNTHRLYCNTRNMDKDKTKQKTKKEKKLAKKTNRIHFSTKENNFS